jgi:predicted AAA+ superfamily ATPase
MIPRQLAEYLRKAAIKMPVITLTGPRQSGKTTLVKNCFPDYTYVNLEQTDLREFAANDAKKFFETFPGSIILDEVQQVPELFSYIQGIADQEGDKRRIVLSGSQNFLLLEKISQTLAGRAAIFYLFPFSIRELTGTKYSADGFEEYIFKGFYPRIYDRGLEPEKWLDDYLLSYVERDVRSLLNVGDLVQFQRFVKLCAGRIGQLVNFSEIGNELGISYHTVQKWLSVLETSFIIFRLQPWHSSYNKRIVKSSKLYFCDSGLAAFLLGIRNRETIDFHYARGALFENLIMAELMKSFYNTGRRPAMYFWRDVSGNEVDCLIEYGNGLIPVEIKMGSSISNDWFKGLKYMHKLTGLAKPESSFLVYGGSENQERSECKILSWNNAYHIAQMGNPG